MNQFGLRSAALILLVLATAGPAQAQVRNDDAWEVLVPNQIVEDAVWWNGRLVGADPRGGLVLFDPETDRVEFFTTADGLTSNRVQSLFVDDQERLWAGTEDAGIVRLGLDGSVRAITGLQDQIDVTVIDGAGSSVYYGSEAGAGRLVSGLPERTFTVTTGLNSNRVQAVAAYGERVWFGTDRGVNEFDLGRNDLVSLDDGLPSLNVLDLHADADGVWAATASGVVRLDESDPDARRWLALNPPLGNRIIDIERKDGTLLALGVDNGLWLLTEGANSWTREEAPLERFAFRACVFDGSGRPWAGGRRRNPGYLGFDPTPVFWNPQAGPSPVARGLFGVQPRGADIDGAGGMWIGAFPSFEGLTHWRADGSVVAYNRPDTGSSDGWLGGPKLVVRRTRGGDIWVSGFSVGVTRFTPADADPEAASYLHLRPASSPIRADRVRAIVEDGRGSVWFGGSNEETETGLNRGLDILVDPSAPLASASWLKIDTDNSLLAGDAIQDLEVGTDGTMWIAVEGAGVQRWDYDGNIGSGRVEAATFMDPSAWQTFSTVPTIGGLPLEKVSDIALGPDGRVWAATTDLGLFGWIPSSFVAANDVVRAYVSFGKSSLLSNQVRSVAVDGTGAVWAGSQAGLHRVVDDGGDLTVTAFTDFAAFLGFNLGDRYLPEILSPLPGANVGAVINDASHERIHLVTNSGAVRLPLPDSQGGEGDDVVFSIYPNPLRGGDLVHAEGFAGEANFEIYNLLGVLVHQRSGVVAGEEIWDGQTAAGANASSGLYLVRFVQDGVSAVKTLAVER